MKKYILHPIILLLTFFCLSACSDNNTNNETDPTEPDGDKKKFSMSLHIAKTNENIYELMSFELHGNRSHTLLDIRDTYDSLVFSIPKLGRRNLLTKNNYSWLWSHCFMLPGEYITTLQGYKDDKIITENSITITIENKSDFLSYNWKNVEVESMTMGYADSFDKQTTWEHYTRVGKNGNYLFVHFFVRNKDREKDYLLNDEKKEYLSNYLNTLYGKPKYTEENVNELKQAYEQMFNMELTNPEPSKIWVTPTTKMVLVKEYNTFREEEVYNVYAEPINQ